MIWAYFLHPKECLECFCKAKWFMLWKALNSSVKFMLSLILFISFMKLPASFICIFSSLSSSFQIKASLGTCRPKTQSHIYNGLVIVIWRPLTPNPCKKRKKKKYFALIRVSKADMTFSEKSEVSFSKYIYYMPDIVLGIDRLWLSRILWNSPMRFASTLSKSVFLPGAILLRTPNLILPQIFFFN